MMPNQATETEVQHVTHRSAARRSSGPTPLSCTLGAASCTSCMTSAAWSTRAVSVAGRLNTGSKASKRARSRVRGAAIAECGAGPPPPLPVLVTCASLRNRRCAVRTA